MDDPTTKTSGVFSAGVGVVLFVAVFAGLAGYGLASTRVSVSNSKADLRSTWTPTAIPTSTLSPPPCQNYNGDGEYWLCIGNSITTNANGFSAQLTGFPSPDRATFALNPPIWLPNGLGGPSGGQYVGTYTFPAVGNGAYGYSVLELQPNTVTAQTRYFFKVKSVDFGDGAFANWRALVWVQTRPYAPRQPTITCKDYHGDGIYGVCTGNSVTASNGSTFKVKRIPGRTLGPIAMPAVIETSGGDVSVKLGGSVVSNGATLYVIWLNYLTEPITLDVCVGSGANASRCGVLGPSPRPTPIRTPTPTPVHTPTPTPSPTPTPKSDR